MSKTLAFELRIEGLAGQIDRIAELESELHQTKEMLKLFKKEGEDFRGVLSQMEKLKLALKEERSELAKNNAELKKSAEGTKTLMNAQVSMSQTERQWQAENRKMLQEENRLKKEIAARRKADVEQAIRDNEIEKKSLIGMRLELERMKKEYYALSEAQRNSTMGRNMLNDVQRQNAAVSSIEQSVGVYSRNVGNYPLAEAGNMVASNLTGGILGNGAAAGYAAAAAGLIAIGKHAIEINTEIDKVQANVRKTTGLNVQAVEDLTDRLKKIDTTTTLADLLKISEVAGRFGVSGEKAVGDFTEAVNTLNIALGDEFGGGVDEITTIVAKMSNVIYGASTNGTEMAERFLRLGNVLNSLANTSAASASEIADVATRIGGMGKALHFTDSEILGVSASIVEMGINVERGSTAFVTLNSKMRSNVEGFAKASGIAKDELKQLMDTKPLEAMNKVISALVNKSGGSGTELLGMLKNLKVSDAGVSEIFLKWADNQSILNRNLETSADNIGNINSLLSEQQNMMNSIPAQWDRLWNSINKSFVSSGLQSSLTGFLRTLTDIIDIQRNGTTWQVAKYNANKTLAAAGKFVPFLRPFRGGAERRANTLRDIIISGERATSIDSTFLGGVDIFPGQGLLSSSLVTSGTTGGGGGGGAGGGAGGGGKPKTPKDYGAVDSITYMKQQVSELEAKMNKTDPKDTAKIQGYIKAIDELNAKIKAANEELEYQKKLFAAKDRVTPGDLPTIEGKTSGGIVQSDKDKKKQHEQEYQEMVDFNNRISKNNQEQTEKEKREERNKRNFIIDSTSQTINQLTDLWDAYNERRTQKDLDALDALYEKKLAAAQGNATLEKALAEEQAREREKIEKKARKKSQDMAILQANINGALAITEIWANTVDPTPFKGFKIAATVMAGLQTAMQIAIIKAQSFAEGGFTGPGMGERDETGHRVAGVVHEDEYVAPKSQIARYPALFQSLERDRVVNYKPFARGGFTTSAELPPMPMPYQQGMGEGGMITFARIVAAETFEAVKAGAIIGAQESNRIAERETIVNVNKVR